MVKVVHREATHSNVPGGAIGTRIEVKLVNNIIHLKVNFYQATSAIGVVVTDTMINVNAQHKGKPVINVAG